MAITQVVIPANLGQTIKPNHLQPNKYDVDAATLVSTDIGNDITIGADGKLKLVEEITTIDSLAVVSGNLELKYTNETNTQQTVSMPASAICAECSSCFEVDNTVTYTAATKPATGSPGQLIFVSDLLASDGSTGCLQMWQPSTNSWKKVMIT